MGSLRASRPSSEFTRMSSKDYPSKINGDEVIAAVAAENITSYIQHPTANILHPVLHPALQGILHPLHPTPKRTQRFVHQVWDDKAIIYARLCYCYRMV